MEREFLKSLAETRAMEATLTANMRAAEGDEPSDSSSTRRGASGQHKQIQELADRVSRLRSQLASERTRFSALHNGWKVRCCGVHEPGHEPLTVLLRGGLELPLPLTSPFMLCATGSELPPLAHELPCIHIVSNLQHAG